MDGEKKAWHRVGECVLERETEGEREGEHEEKGREECETPTATFHPLLLALPAAFLHCLLFFCAAPLFTSHLVHVKTRDRIAWPYVSTPSKKKGCETQSVS